MVRGARPRLLGTAPRCADRDRDAGPVRDRRQGDRERGRRDVRGVRLVRPAPAGRFQRVDTRARGGPDGTRTGRCRVRLRRDPGLAQRMARSRGDGPRRVRRAVRRRRQLGPRERFDRPAAGVHPPRVPRQPGLDDPGPPGWLGHGIGGLDRGDRGPVAGAEERSAASAGRGGLESARRAPPRRGRARARHSRCDDRGHVRAGDRPGRHSRGRAAPRLPRDPLPPDRPEHAGKDDRTARRRPELAERHRPEQVDPRHGRTRPLDLCGQDGCRHGARTRSRPARDAGREPGRPAVGRRRATRIAGHDGAHGDRGASRLPDSGLARWRRAPGPRVPHDARSELPRAGAELRGLADRAEHRADHARRAAGLVGPPARSPARGCRRSARVRTGARCSPPRAPLGVAPQQRARRRGAGVGCARREPERRAALVLGDLRDAVRAPFERPEHGPVHRTRRRRHGHRIRDRSGGARGHRIGHHAPLGHPAHRRADRRTSLRPSSRSQAARPHSRSRC